MLPAALPASSCAHPFIAQMASSPGGAALIVSKRVFILENKAVESERSCCVVHSLLLPRQASAVGVGARPDFLEGNPLKPGLPGGRISSEPKCATHGHLDAGSVAATGTGCTVKKRPVK